MKKIEQESKEKKGNPSRRDSDPIEKKPIQEQVNKLDTLKVMGCTKGELRREKFRQFIYKIFRTKDLEWLATRCIVIVFFQSIFFIIATGIGLGYNSYFFGYDKVKYTQVIIGTIILNIIALIIWKFFFSKEKI